MWANLYAYFQRLPEDAFLKATFGPGGHFIVAAIFRLCSCLVLRATPAECLNIEDIPANAKTGEPAESKNASKAVATEAKSH